MYVVIAQQVALFGKAWLAVCDWWFLSFTCSDSSALTLAQVSDIGLQQTHWSHLSLRASWFKYLNST